MPNFVGYTGNLSNPITSTPFTADLYLNQNGFKQDLPTALKGIGNLEKLGKI